MRRCTAACTLGKKTRHKIQRCTYIIQRAGEAVYSEAGKAQIAEQIAYYHKNASYIFNGLKEAGYTVAGGVNSPYVWLKTPEQMNSWEFFDYLLDKANVVGTPGSGFGPSGEGYFRLTSFGSYETHLKRLNVLRNLNNVQKFGREVRLRSRAEFRIRTYRQVLNTYDTAVQR